MRMQTEKIHYCGNCGQPNTHGLFCGSCGARLAGAGSPPEAPRPAVPAKPAAVQRSASGRRLAFGISAAVLIVFSLAYAIWSLVSIDSAPVTPVTAPSETGETITSDDGTVTLRMPAGWTQGEDPSVALRAEDRRNTLALMVAAGPKSEGAEASSVSELARTAVKSFAEGMSLAVEAGPTRTTVRGNDAIVYELSGASRGALISAIHTTIVTSTHIAVTAAFGPTDAFESQRTQIVRSLRSLKIRQED